jgi:putative transcriptional regulator
MKLNRIKEILTEKGITQYQLSKSSKIGYPLITAYYHGKREPSLKTLFKIAKALKVDPRELLKV